MNILEVLLEYENRGTVLEYRFAYKDILMWPIIRYQIFLEYTQNEMNAASDLKKEEKAVLDSKWKRLLKSAGCIIEVAFSNLRHADRCDILFIYGNSGNELRGEQYYNRFFDYYAELLPQKSKMLELNYENKIYRNRAVSNIYYGDTIDGKIEWMAKISKLKGGDRETVARLILDLRSYFGNKFSEEFYIRTEKMLHLFSKKIRYVDKYYGKVFKKLSPKLVIMEDASYGFDKACKLWVLHNMGILSAEMQHGMIGLNHSAYNYADTILNSDYQNYLPRYYLTYGGRWNSLIHTTSKAVVIGAPELAKKLSVYDFKEREKKGTILIALGMYGTHFVKFLRDLWPYLTERNTVVVKSHPNKAAWGEPLEEFLEFEKYVNFVSVPQGNIYDYIAEAEYVISDFSTTLFEADACGKKVCVYDCVQARAYIPKSLGSWFHSADEFLDIVKKYQNGQMIRTNQETYYNLNWEENYREFLSDIQIG